MTAPIDPQAAEGVRNFGNFEQALERSVRRQARIIRHGEELVEALRECLPYVTQAWVETGDSRTAERHERAASLLRKIEGGE